MSGLQVPPRDFRVEPLIRRVSQKNTNKQNRMSGRYVALMEAHWKFPSSEILQLVFNGLAIAHPDNIGELTLAAE